MIMNATLNESSVSNSSEEDETRFLSEENYDLFGVLVEGYALTFVSFWGFFGNLISIYILSQRQFASPVCRLLIALATYDALYLLTSTLAFGLPKMSLWYVRNVYIFAVPTVYGFLHIGRVGSVFATLSITLERYFAVKWPLGEKRLQKALLYGTIIFSIVFNLPKFYELRTDYVFNNDTNTKEPVLVAGDLRKNIYYSTYYIFWSKFLLIEFIPYIMLIVLNVSIMSTTHKAMTERQRLGIQLNRVQRLSKDEAQMSKILLTIVIVFVSCQSLKIIPDLYEVLTCCHNRAQCLTTPFIEGITDLSHFLLAVNSSINFIIYIIRGSMFRKVFAQKFYPKRRRDNCLLHRSFVRGIYTEDGGNHQSRNANAHTEIIPSGSRRFNPATTILNNHRELPRNSGRITSPKDNPKNCFVATPVKKKYFTGVMKQTYV